MSDGALVVAGRQSSDAALTEHVAVYLPMLAQGQGEIAEASKGALAAIERGVSAPQAAADLLVTHPAVGLVALLAELSEGEQRAALEAVGADGSQRAAVAALIAALDGPLRAGLRAAMAGQDSLPAVRRPRSLFERALKVDLRKLMTALGKAAVDGVTGRWDTLVKDAIDAGAALGLAESTADKAAALVTIAMQRAVALLVKESLWRLTESADAAPEMEMAFEVELDRTFFAHPERLPLVASVGRQLAAWLAGKGLAPERARGVAERLGPYFAAEVAAEWRRRPEVYAAVWAAADTPFSGAEERARDWARYRARLMRGPAESLFGDTVALQQVYQPLRAWWAERNESAVEERDELFDRKPRRRATQPARRVVVDVEAALAAWMEHAEDHDAVRIVSGGPGAGKSSLSVVFAADRAARGERVVRVALHLFEFERGLREGLAAYARQMCGLDHDLFDEAGPLVLVFDGLDELSMQGRAGRDAVVELVEAMLRLVEQARGAGRRLRVLLLGRELVVQALGERCRQEGMVLHLLGYVVSETQQRSYHDPAGRVTSDQRADWWQAYGRCTGDRIDGLPPELARGRLAMLTAEPLLNYLIALTRSARRVRLDDPALNENLIYADLVRQVFERSHAEGRRLPGAAEVSREDYERFLEAVALAAWHGEGRAASVDEIRKAAGERLLGKLPALQEQHEQGISRLMTVFYFRGQHMRADGAKTFEFTHKSFGEYLLARRLVGFLALLTEEAARYEEGRGGWSPTQRLVEWYRVFGPAAMDEHVFGFVHDELRLRASDVVQAWHGLIGGLLRVVIRDEFPLEEGNQRQPFRVELARSRNAGEALLVIASACARVDGAHTVVEGSDVSAFANWLTRLMGAPGGVRLCRRHLDQFSLVAISLPGAWLPRAILRGSNLQGCDLTRANLVKADLSGADLRNAYLSGADLSGADLGNANLGGADLAAADLRDANLSGAHLSGAYLGGAYLGGAYLGRAHLDGAHLNAAHLDGADLSGADLGGANLHRADLSGAELSGANLRGADLRHAHLGDADLVAADLRGANLGSADLRLANLDGADLQYARASKHTRWPDGFDPSRRGVGRRR